jgi:hypothetical protein
MLKSLTFRRWVDIICLSLVSLTLVVVASQSSWVVRNYNRWAEINTSLPWYMQITLGCLGLYCIYKMLLDFKVIHPNHRKHLCIQFRYPPLYFSIPLAIFGLLISSALPFQNTIELNTVLFITVLVVVATALNQHEKSKIPIKMEFSEDQNIPFTIEKTKFVEHLQKINRHDLIEFHTWIKKEEPTEIGESDDFDRYIYVSRLSKILLKQSNTPCHIAIAGEFGSGKSSITDTVIKNIKEVCNSYICVKVDGWGRSEKSCAAQILEEIVESLSKNIDCSSIKNIPKHYLDALAGSNLQGAKSLAGWIQNYQKPNETLRKIESILAGIDKRLLIVLEDFDRQPNSDNAISEIAALLDRLKKYNRINFVINVGYQANSEILSKICTRREDIGDVRAEGKLNTLIELMSEYDAYKNPLDVAKDKSLIKQTAGDIYKFIKTPRDLKQIFRRVYATWEVLAGEIDIYDLITINIIRYTKPKAFDFICNNIAEFRRLVIDKEFSKIEGGKLKFYETSELPEETLMPSAINNLIARIFPSDIGESEIDLLKNQRIAFKGETDFFKRILHESAGNDSDVLAIKKLSSLSNKSSTEVKDEILEISKSTFLIEKLIQFNGYCDETTKKPIIDKNLIYKLLAILTSDEHLRDQKNIEGYFDNLYIKELLRVFSYTDNHEGAIEIFKRFSQYSLDGFIILAEYLRSGHTKIEYDKIIVETLVTPAIMKTALINSKYDSLYTVLDDFFIRKNSNHLERFMLLILETLKTNKDLREFGSRILNTTSLDSSTEEKMEKCRERIRKVLSVDKEN